MKGSPHTPIPVTTPDIATEHRNYAYIVSHDLSAPIRAINEFSKLLQQECQHSLTQEGEEYLSFIMNNAQKLNQMMDGLLQYSRLTNLAPLYTSFPLNDIAVQTADTLLPDINSHSLPIITADQQQITTLLQLLYDNAVKFRNKDKTLKIDLHVKENSHEWHIVMSDNGIGIASRFYPKLFKPFGRLHTDEDYPGIGMGLALAKKIITNHQGEIWLEPSPSGGLSIHFTLAKPTVQHALPLSPS